MSVIIERLVARRRVREDEGEFVVREEEGERGDRL
jgi:hypothetical protein